MPDFKRIKAEYIRGGTSYRKLAAKYGVSLSSVTRRAIGEKWADLRKQSETKANAKIVESVASRSAKRAEMFDSIADKLLKMISDGIDDGSLAVAVAGRGYRDITGALKDLREIKGLKAELDMQEQIARIEKLRRESTTEEETDGRFGVLLLPAVSDGKSGEAGG